MTTAVMNNRAMVVGERPRRSLEELVDRVMDALFASNREQSTAQSVAKSVHDARRLRKAGEPGRCADAVSRAWTPDTADAQTRRVGPSPSGRTWCDDGSGKARPWSTARAPAELRRSLPTATGPWKSWLCWGWGGSRARWSPRGACGA